MKIIAYYRVSTDRQKRSGLGLAAQRKAVHEYAKRMGYTIAEEYEETESGTDSDRPKLQKAMEHARSVRGILVIAKLDRLSRNMAMVAKLMDSPVDFVCCDNPVASRLTIHVMAAVAEEEARQISERTKAALAAAKASGVKLGSARPDHWKGREHLRGWKTGAKKSSEIRKRNAQIAYAFVYEEMKKMRAAGDSLDTIAKKLNLAGHRTTTGNEFNAPTIWRIFKRFEKSA